MDLQGSRYVPGQILSSVLGSGFFRVALVGVCVACAIYGTRSKDASMQSHPSQVGIPASPDLSSGLEGIHHLVVHSPPHLCLSLSYFPT